MTIATVPMTDLCQLLASTSDGAFIVGKDLRILFWNQSAQKILGHAPKDVVGQHCREVLNGHNDRNGEVGRCHCHVTMAVFREYPAPNFDVCARTKSGQVRWINVSTLVCTNYDNGATPMIVHLFRDHTQNKQNEQFVQQVLNAAKCLQTSLATSHPHPSADTALAQDLTDREREILELLAKGLSTHDITRSLSISLSTTRNHIQNILRKLDARSRLEAVVYALEYGLITRNWDLPIE
jgi:PAS domain S-box-containing protein